MRNCGIFVAGILVLAGCSTVPAGYYYEASSGNRVDSSPAMLSKFELAKTACEGEAMKAAMAGNYERSHPRTELVRRGCMADRGYIVRPN